MIDIIIKQNEIIGELLAELTVEKKWNKGRSEHISDMINETRELKEDLARAESNHKYEIEQNSEFRGTIKRQEKDAIYLSAKYSVSKRATETARKEARNYRLKLRRLEDRIRKNLKQGDHNSEQRVALRVIWQEYQEAERRRK
jgi:hypothetical protein